MAPCRFGGRCACARHQSRREGVRFPLESAEVAIQVVTGGRRYIRGMPEHLVGGYRSGARREGNEVHRGPTSPYAVQLLRFLTLHQWPYSPALISSSSQASVLEFIDGTAAVTPAQRAAAGADSALAATARMVRELHDLTAGTYLSRGGEVACHHDLDPRNTIYRRDGDVSFPVALIDWDSAGPGRRVHDLAHLCWTYTGINPTAVPDLIWHRIRVCLEAYEWTGTDREVVRAMLWWQDRCHRGIRAEAEAGDPAMRALVANGVMDAVRSDYDWTVHNLSHG